MVGLLKFQAALALVFPNLWRLLDTLLVKLNPVHQVYKFRVENIRFR
jgi:hypothetical protein